MRALDIILKKRDGLELTQEEIKYFIEGYTRGDIPDYQASAWAMAVLFRGMTPRETTELTLAMAYSGDTIDLSDHVKIVVDKHSTGGVGDKTTLVVGPVVAACGLPVGKMSGRGLGFSGGTLDKLESIPGFRADLSTDEFIEQLTRVGLVVCGQTANLAPADGKLYALRDVTGTVQSIPLIASSIMSKKIAAGAQAIVLDVKVGSGAFMKSLEEARELAELMVSIARLANRRALAVISDMNQPLGCAVGNAIELIEAIETLKGTGPIDFTQHCQEIAGLMLTLGGKTSNVDDAKKLVEAVLNNGRAWEMFLAMIRAQGGDVATVEDPTRLPRAVLIKDILSPKNGYVQAINAQLIGETVMGLGGGRTRKGEKIDYGVGIVVHAKVGDYLTKGDPLISIHANSESELEMAKQNALQAIKWSTDPVDRLPLFYGLIDQGMGLTGINQ